MVLSQINDFCFYIYVLGHNDCNEKDFRKFLYIVTMVTLEMSADKPQKDRKNDNIAILAETT